MIVIYPNIAQRLAFDLILGNVFSDRVLIRTFGRQMNDADSEIMETLLERALQEDRFSLRTRCHSSKEE